MLIDAVQPPLAEVEDPYAGFVVKFKAGFVAVIAVLLSSTPLFAPLVVIEVGMLMPVIEVEFAHVEY